MPNLVYLIYTQAVKDHKHGGFPAHALSRLGLKYAHNSDMRNIYKIIPTMFREELYHIK
jgi:hypothetical protein